MKKLYFTLLLAAASFANLHAQSILSGVKSFFSDVEFDFSAGLGTTYLTEPYDEDHFSPLNFGLDVSKPILSFDKDKKWQLYGMTGVHWMINGGLQTHNAISLFGDEESTCTFGQAYIPLHVGFRRVFKKCSIFMDFGPNFAFTTDKEKDIEGLETKGFEFAIGGALGFRFKRFGLSLRVTKGLTDVVNYRDPGTFREYSMKSSTYSACLHWIIGKVK